MIDSFKLTFFTDMHLKYSMKYILKQFFAVLIVISTI